MTTRLENFGIINTTYETLNVNGYEIKDDFQMSLVLKATGMFKKYTLAQLQEWGYDRMYDELCNKLTEKGLI